MKRPELAGALALSLLLAGSFAAGVQWAGGSLFGLRKAPEPPVGVVEQLAEVQAELDMARTRSEVDEASLEMVRAEIAAQKEQLAVLEEELQFYRSLMSPEELAQGLSLRDMELVALEQPGEALYTYSLTGEVEANTC